MNFQEYLISKGWKRYYYDFSINSNNPPKVYSNSQFISTYGPTEYYFEHPNYSDINLWWGLYLKGKPPVFSLNNITYVPLTRKDKYISEQDNWFNTFKTFDIETIYNLLINKGMIYIFDGKLFLKPLTTD